MINVLVDSYPTISNWIFNVITKTNRKFYKIGYSRAAYELQRLGYVEEAKRCRELLEEIKNKKSPS